MCPHICEPKKSASFTLCVNVTLFLFNVVRVNLCECVCVWPSHVNVPWWKRLCGERRVILHHPFFFKHGPHPLKNLKIIHLLWLIFTFSTWCVCVTLFTCRVLRIDSIDRICFVLIPFPSFNPKSRVCVCLWFSIFFWMKIPPYKARKGDIVVGKKKLYNFFSIFLRSPTHVLFVWKTDIYI